MSNQTESRIALAIALTYTLAVFLILPVVAQVISEKEVHEASRLLDERSDIREALKLLVARKYNCQLYVGGHCCTVSIETARAICQAREAEITQRLRVLGVSEPGSITVTPFIMEMKSK